MDSDCLILVVVAAGMMFLFGFLYGHDSGKAEIEEARQNEAGDKA